MLWLIFIGSVLLMIVLGIRISHCSYPVQYMANAEELPKVEDICGYNHALGRNFILFGMLLLIVLLPMLLPMPYAMLMLFCIPFWAIGFMLRCMQIQTRYEAQSSKKN